MPVYIFRSTSPNIISKGRWSLAAESAGGKPVVSVNDTFRFSDDNGPTAYMITAGSKHELVRYLYEHSKLNFTVEGKDAEIDDYDFDNTDDNSNTMDGITISWRLHKHFDPKVKTTKMNAGRDAAKNLALGFAGAFGMPGSGPGVGTAEALGDAVSTAAGFVRGGSAASGRLALELNILYEGNPTGKQSISARRLASLLEPEKIKRVRKKA